MPPHIFECQPGREAMASGVAELIEFCAPCRWITEASDTSFGALAITILVGIVVEEAPIELDEVLKERFRAASTRPTDSCIEPILVVMENARSDMAQVLHFFRARNAWSEPGLGAAGGK